MYMFLPWVNVKLYIKTVNLKRFRPMALELSCAPLNSFAALLFSWHLSINEMFE